MSRSTRIRIATLAAGMASMLLVGANPKAPFDPLSAVPSGAIAVATVGDPAALLANAIGFMRSAGLESPATSLEWLMDRVLSAGDPAAGGAVPGDAAEGDAAATAIMRAIDVSRRFVVAVYPAGNGAEDDSPVSALAFVPLRAGLPAGGREALEAAIDEKLGMDDDTVAVSLDYPGYLAVGTGGIGIPAYGSPGSMDLSRLAAHPASSIAIWADPAAAAELLEKIPGGLGSLMTGSSGDDDDGWEDDWDEEYEEYEEWSDDMPVEPGYDPSLDNSAAGSAALDNTSGATAGAGVEAESGNETDAESGPEAGEEYADDFSWEETDGEAGDGIMDSDGAMDRLGEAFKAGLAELTGVELALTVHENRAWIRLGAELAAGGRLASMAARASEGDRSMPYLSWCEADAIMSFAWSAPQDWFAPMLEAVYRLVLPDEAFIDSAMDSMRTMAAASGPNGGASIGIDLSEELVQAVRSGKSLDDGQALDLVSGGLGLRATGAIELRDRQAFRDATAAMADIVKNPGYVDLLAASGMAFAMDRKVGTTGGLPYDAYTYTFSPAGGPDAAEDGDATAAAVAAMLGKLISPVYVYKDDKAFIGLGSPAAATEAIARGGARLPLRADKEFKALRAVAPADTRALFYVSTKSLARTILRLMPQDREAPGFNVNALSGLLGWFDATPGTLGFGFGIGSEDIKAVIALSD